MLRHFELERFTGRRHDDKSMQPYYEACLANAGITWDDVAAVIEPTASSAWSQRVSPDPPGWDSGWQHLGEVHRGGVAMLAGTSGEPVGERPLDRISHHMSHACYAFYTSPYAQARVVTMDGGGDCFYGPEHPQEAWIAGASRGHFVHDFGGCIPHFRLEHPPGLENSTGGAWTTHALALTGNPNDAGTAMALGTAACDHPLKESIRETQRRTHHLFQAHARACAPFGAVVLGGGCALNGPAAYGLLQEGVAQHLWVPPAVNDGGLTVGAALFAWCALLGRPREYHRADTIAFAGWDPGVGSMSRETATQVALLIEAGGVVGVFQGRAESGPRALGHRSILATPTRPEMRARINDIKGRQPYRPVAPATTAAFALEHFDLYDDVAYAFMTCIARSRPSAQGLIPAGLHDDGSARVQIATPQSGLMDVLNALATMGCPPCVLNTSFNRRGQAMVHTPDQAREVARELELDAVVIGEEFEVLCT